MVFAVPNGWKKLLYKGGFVAERSPFVTNCIFSEEWRPGFDPLIARHAAAIAHGGLALAHLVIDLLSAYAIYLDLRPLYDRYPRLGSLLDGEVNLPALNDYTYRQELDGNVTTKTTNRRSSP
jgi:hypothetical protein